MNAPDLSSKSKCNKHVIINQPRLIKTSLHAIITFSDSSHNCLSPAEDPGNLSADLTQSETTAELLDPELLGDLFNSGTTL